MKAVTLFLAVIAVIFTVEATVTSQNQYMVCRSVERLSTSQETLQTNATGTRGPIGLPGKKGPRGLEGPKGSHGFKGSPGPKGLQGSMGLQGPKGLRGSMGFQGPRGKQGPTGFKGSKCAPGAKGDPGIPGLDGLPGLPGPIGLNGPRGLIGPRAPKGLKGVGGPKGPKGSKGYRGSQDPRVQRDLRVSREQRLEGISWVCLCELKMKAVTLLLTVIAVIFTVEGTATSQNQYMVCRSVERLSYTIQETLQSNATGTRAPIGLPGKRGPRGTKGLIGLPGAKGLPGPRGLEGPKGSQGSKGSPGPRGNSGAKGLQGLKGSQGPNGLRGPRGVQGLTGLKGSKGASGATGVAGPKGLKGSRGVIGPKGLKGARAVNGPRGPKGIKGVGGAMGPKGSIGPKGNHGLRGRPGSSANVNWAEVDRRIQRAMQNYVPTTTTVAPTTTKSAGARCIITVSTNNLGENYHRMYTCDKQSFPSIKLIYKGQPCLFGELKASHITVCCTDAAKTYKMRVVAMLLILSAVTFTVESTVRNQYMVCRSVEGIYDPNQEIQQSNATSVRGPMGRPGKRGPRGLQGSKGPQGPIGLQGLPGSSAAMNWTEIDRRIQVAMQNYMREMQQDFTTVRMPTTASTLPSTSTTISTVTPTIDISDCDGVAYHGRCIWLPFSSFGNGRKKRAETVCNQVRGTLVDIESEEMFNLVYSYVKTSYNSGVRDSVIVWLASTLENDGGVRSSRGSATYTKWYSNRRISWRPQINCLVFSVNTKPTKLAYGMIAVPPYFPRAVPLCLKTHKMKAVVLLLVFAAVILSAESTIRNWNQNQYMVCRSVEGIYDPNQEIQQSNVTSVRGPMGRPGKRGPRGLQGPRGSQGPIGLQGPTGLQGPKGLQGLIGVQGPKGSKGLRGFRGYKGSQGPMGLLGPMGLQGTKGSQGLGWQGTKGAQGPRGFLGAKGSMGIQGPKGSKGTIGLRGPTGWRGFHGQKGSQGSRGVQGLIGVQGRKGSQGSRGVQGYKGLRGPPGPSANVNWAEVDWRILAAIQRYIPTTTTTTTPLDTTSTTTSARTHPILTFCRNGMLVNGLCIPFQQLRREDLP
ncbi:uncharacterized protein LOC104265805 [Ciona intestinalis]